MSLKIWQAKIRGAYARTSAEAITNGENTWAVLGARGWSKQAVAGFLGNVGHEGGYNPWRWQGDRVQPTYNTPWTNIGYGFTQFTPAGKYINSGIAKAIPGYAPNFSNQMGQHSDAYAQLVFVDEHADYKATSSYPYDYATFKRGEYEYKHYFGDGDWEWRTHVFTAFECAAIWLVNYERPTNQSQAVKNIRGEEADYWYGVLGGIPPEPDIPGERTHVNPQIYIFTPAWRRFLGKN